MATAPELDPTTPAALEDPFAFYAEAREQAPLIRLALPGLGAIWTLTRHADARAMLGDPRFAITPGSFQTPPGVPEEYVGYLHTMSELDGPEHLRLRRLLTPAFAPRRIAGFRAEIAGIVDGLLDALPVDEPVDLLERFTKPLPMEVICAIAGIREPERPRWHEFGATIVSGAGSAFGAAVPEFVEAAKAEVAARRREPGTDLVSDLVRTATEDGDRLTDTEVVTLIWHLLLAGQTPVNLIANAVEALLHHPDQLAALRADHGLIPSAVEEFLR
ncbi:hypothetical protein [Sciscionella marina]|uniref:hypothetical protein n=1 Tax=Sciscionella marina TaxID=508770 RepID=UPI000365BE3A